MAAISSGLHITWFDPRLLGICSVVDRCAKLTRSGFIDRPLGDLTARGQPRSGLEILIEINPIRTRVIPVNRTVIPLLLFTLKSIPFLILILEK